MSQEQELDTRTQDLILRAELSATVQRSIVPVASGLSVLYAIFTVSHWALLPDAIRLPMALTAGITALVFVGLSRYVRSRGLPLRLTDPVAAGMAGLVLFNSWLHLWLTKDILQTTNLLLLIVGSAFFLLSPVWFGTITALCVGSWILTVITFAPPSAMVHFAFALASSMLLAVLIHRERRRTLRRVETLRLQDEHRRAQLEIAIQQVRRSEESYREMAESARKMESLVRREHEFTEAVLDTAGALILVLDPDGRIVRFNHACERTTGYAAAEVEGQRFWDRFLIPEEREAVRSVFADLRAGHFPATYTNDWITRDGDRRMIEWSSTALVNDADEVTYIIATGIDVTERRQTERALAERTSYLEGVLAAAPDAIITLDNRHRVLEWNAGAQRLFGYRPDEVVGHYIDPLITNEATVEEAVGLTEDATHGRDVGPLETVRYCKDGRPVNVIVAGSPIVIGDELVGAAAVYTDISRLKAAEDSLRQRNADLDAFSHTVAHDLKGPLNNIFGYANLLQMAGAETPSATLTEGIDVIAASAARMSNIIDALLLLAGLRGGEFEPHEVAMQGVVDEALARLAYMIREYAADIRLPETWPSALGYAPWIEEVWANYVSNAIKYGGRPPEITLGAAQEHGDMVRFWVRDNGPGLTPEEQAQLFVPFTRLNQVRVAGHGLGLSIVRRIVERLGGQVGVESTPGDGSEFYFCLPTH